MAFGTSAQLSGALLFIALAACDRGSSSSRPSNTAVTPTESAAESVATSKTPEPAAEGPWYRVELFYKGVGELPFFMQLPPERQNGPVKVVNGDETTEFKIEWRDQEATITSPWNYVSVMEAQLDATGTLHGTWTRNTPLWGEVVRELVARPIDKPDPQLRFPGDESPTTDVAGIWEFRFDQHKEGKGVLEQTKDGVVRGYIKPGQLGDIRFLAGNVRGNKLQLSHFNGNAANLVIAEVAPDGSSMSGLMSMQNVWNEKFTAKKVDDFEFVNKVHLKKGKKTVSLLGLDKYRGKPTLAIIFATWCSSCNDAAPYLRDLYAEYHPKGLEILSVAYDLSMDEKANLAELEAFRKKYDVKWEMLQVPCTPETWPEVMPPELVGWDGLPILMLVKPDGSVQTVFGGWFGPATGEEGQKRQKWFEGAVDALVAHAN